MSLSPGDIVALNALEELAAPADGDMLPILRSSPMQFTPAANLAAYVVNSAKYYGAVGNGVADDTGALQQAIAMGAPFYLPAGVYRTTSTLTLNAAANHGQVIRGAGPTASDGTGMAKAVIRPDAGVSVALRIDGTAFGGYVQGFAVENLTIDMVNMPDSATSVAVAQGQAFDGRYHNIRVINFGASKVSWLYETGAYVTKMANCQGGVVQFLGTAIDNATTTIVLDNCDVQEISANYAVNITLNGGAVQRPYSAAVPVLYLAPGTTPYGYLVNTAGLYVAVMSEIDNVLHFTSNGCDWEQGGGYPSTFNDGTHGTLPLIRVVQVTGNAINTRFINPQFAGMYLLDYGLNTTVEGYQTTGYDITSGVRHHLDDINVGALIQGFSDFPNFAEFGTYVTFTLNATTGSAKFLKTTCQPATDGDEILVVKNASGLPLMDFTTNGAGLALENGTPITGFTDSFTTQTWTIASSTGTANFRALNIQPAIDGNSIVLLKNAMGASLFGLNTNATASASTPFLENGLKLQGYSDAGSTLKWSIDGASGAVKTGVTTVGALPSPGTAGTGARMMVTDATATTFLSVVAGGGSNLVPVVAAGGNWLIG